MVILMKVSNEIKVVRWNNESKKMGLMPFAAIF